MTKSLPAGRLASPLCPPPPPRFFKTPSGVRVQVLAEGGGPAAAAGDLVLIDYVLRRSNGGCGANV